MKESARVGFNFRKVLLLGLGVFIVIGLAIANSEESSEEDDQSVVISFKDAPSAVQKTIQRILRDKKIDRVEKEVEEGFATFEVEYQANEVKRSVKIASNGKVLERERTISVDTLPENVLSEIAKDYPGAKIDTAEAVQLFFYEITVKDADGNNRKIRVYATGDIEDDEGAKFKDDDDDDEGGSVKGDDDDDDDEDEKGSVRDEDDDDEDDDDEDE